MYTIFALSYFIFGVIIGSFLNVVVLRYNTGRTILGYSKCHSCGIALAWKELFPILSFIVLRGKCSKCRSNISIQYPLVELLTGVTFLCIFLVSSSIIESVFLAIIFSILIAIVVYDVRHKIVPDGLVYTFVFVSLLYVFVNVQSILVGGYFILPNSIELLAGLLVAFPIWILWFISKGRWIGLGDAKIALGMGWFLGIPGGFTALLLSFWIGAFVGVVMLLITHIDQKTILLRTEELKLIPKGLTMKTEIPFAPFMVFSVFLVYFFKLNIIELITLY